MEKLNGSPERSRRLYRRPTLTRVPLRPDEAVLGGCKTASTSGKNIGGSPITCSVPTNCSTPVS